MGSMRIIQFFHSSSSDACRQTQHVLERVVEQEDDIMLVTHDVDTTAGEEKARELEISTVPTTIVDGQRVIRGVPHSPEQVLGDQ